MSGSEKIRDDKRYRTRFRTRPSVDETISRSRTTLLINMIIEISCALILVVGIVYFIRFLLYSRDSMDSSLFKLYMGAIFFFSIGWSAYFILKFQYHFRHFIKAGKDESKP